MSVSIWKPHWKGERVDESRCRASVHDDFGVGFHQCVRKAVVFDAGVGYCKQHSPEQQKKRDDERRRKYEQERKADESRRSRNRACSEVVQLVCILRDANWILNDELKRRLEDAIGRTGQ